MASRYETYKKNAQEKSAYIKENLHKWFSIDDLSPHTRDFSRE